MASKAEDIPDDTLSTKSTSPPDKDEDGIQRPTGLRLYLIFVALCMSTLLVAIDATIIATAIPTITAQFHSLADVSWYNSAFLLTTCGVQLPWGRCYSLLSTKWTFLAAIVVFEIGSAIAGAAPSSFALIMGRAVQGLGGGGIFGGAFQTIAEVTPLEKRSLFTGFIGATFWIASVVGPLLGEHCRHQRFIGVLAGALTNTSQEEHLQTPSPGAGASTSTSHLAPSPWSSSSSYSQPTPANNQKKDSPSSSCFGVSTRSEQRSSSPAL